MERVLLDLQGAEFLWVRAFSGNRNLIDSGQLAVEICPDRSRAGSVGRQMITARPATIANDSPFYEARAPRVPRAMVMKVGARSEGGVVPRRPEA